MSNRRIYRVDGPQPVIPRHTWISRVRTNGLLLQNYIEYLRTNHVNIAQARAIDQILPEPFYTINDFEICFVAVEQNGLALQYCSDEMRNDFQICFAAVQQNGLALRRCSENQRNNIDICLAAVQNNGLALRYCPEPMRTREICLAAVRNNREAMRYVRDDRLQIRIARNLNMQQRQENDEDRWEFEDGELQELQEPDEEAPGEVEVQARRVPPRR